MKDEGRNTTNSHCLRAGPRPYDSSLFLPSGYFSSKFGVMRCPRPVWFLLSALILHPSSFILAQVIVAEKPEFRALVAEDAVVEKVVGGFGFLEGPAWNPVEKFLVFSDIPHDCIYRLDPVAKTGVDFRRPSGSANGNLYNAKGEFFSCQQDPPHRVSITRLDGTTELLPDQWEGKPLSSPNDVAVKSDGTVWFTDPAYGLGKRKKEQATNNVYCYDPNSKEMRAVATDFDGPNGLCFSPDERKLYISDTGKGRHVRVFDVSADNRLSGGAVFCATDKGVPDGIRCDTAGNLWSSAGDGVQVFNPAGERLGRILVPESPANLCFAGVDARGRTDLYITARTSLYRVKVSAAGAAAR